MWLLLYGFQLNLLYNEASMDMTGMELQPTLSSPHNLLTFAEGMKSTLSWGCKKCQLHTASSLCLFLSLSIAFSDTTIHSNSFFCIGLYVVVSAGCGDPPGNLHTSQEYSTFTYLLISFFPPILKATYIDFELLSLQLGSECQFLVAETVAVQFLYREMHHS